MRTYPSAAATTININGTNVFVAIRRGDGSRPPLLLINGIGANLEVFDPFIDALEKVGRKKIGTIRFDVPGVGGSPPTLFPLCFRGLAHLIAQLLDALGHQQVDVLGISWGGGLAQQFAHQYPTPLKAALTRSGMNGTVRRRAPVASYTALASAAPTVEHAASPAPSGGSLGRSIRSMSILGAAEKVRIG